MLYHNANNHCERGKENCETSGSQRILHLMKLRTQRDLCHDLLIFLFIMIYALFFISSNTRQQELRYPFLVFGACVAPVLPPLHADSVISNLCFEMDRRVTSPVESCLNDGKDSVGQLTKRRSWMVCNANGCYRPG